MIATDVRLEVPLFIVFADLAGFGADVRRTGDRDLADILDGLYERVDDRVTAGGGRVVKFVGDAALAVFPEDAGDRVVDALFALKDEADGFLGGHGWSATLTFKVHFGVVMAGPFGAKNDKHFDVIGSDVNAAATLQGRPFVLSAQAFRKLSADARRHFKKHTPPIVYIPVEARRPSS
jgi:class 3 adenylate cyclase